MRIKLCSMRLGAARLFTYLCCPTHGVVLMCFFAYLCELLLFFFGFSSRVKLFASQPQACSFFFFVFVLVVFALLLQQHPRNLLKQLPRNLLQPRMLLQQQPRQLRRQLRRDWKKNEKKYAQSTFSCSLNKTNLFLNLFKESLILSMF